MFSIIKENLPYYPSLSKTLMRARKAEPVVPKHGFSEHICRENRMSRKKCKSSRCRLAISRYIFQKIQKQCIENAYVCFDANLKKILVIIRLKQGCVNCWKNIKKGGKFGYEYKQYCSII